MQDQTGEFLNDDGSINYESALEAGRVERSRAALGFLRRLSGFTPPLRDVLDAPASSGS